MHVFACLYGGVCFQDDDCIYITALQADGLLEALVKTNIIEYCVVNDQEGHWENIATCANNENA